MARDNYAFKKRSRELAQKKKREEKLQRKLAKKNPPLAEGAVPVSGEAVVVQPTPENPIV